MGKTAVSLAGLLLREGAKPYVTEKSGRDLLGPFKDALSGLGVPFECGGHTEKAFEGASLIVPSPGVSPKLEIIQRAVARGTSLTGEMEFAARYCKSKMIAVTGTNGKTTTTELVTAMIKSCGHSVLLAGNNERPLSAAVMQEPAPEYVVLEVSSYQLDLADRFRPWIGAVLNVTHDHLARHGTLDAYAEVKGKIFANQSAGDYAIVNADDSRTRASLDNGPGGPNGDRKRNGGREVWPFSVTQRLEKGVWVDGNRIMEGNTKIADISQVPLRGMHNLENVLASLCVMKAGSFSWDGVLAGLGAFEAVEHRTEFVTTIDGIDYYNDSKSTNLASLRVALESFDSPIVLIAGGQGKGSDYSELKDLVAERVSTLVSIGEESRVLQKTFEGVVEAVQARNMNDAVSMAAERVHPGSVVLLSPGCASFDMFESFEARGREYKACVTRLAQCRESEKRA